MKALNLCDIGLRWSSKEELLQLMDDCEREQKTRFEKIYIGSYFCGYYFLHLTARQMEIWKEISDIRRNHYVLVIPVFSQMLLEQGKKAIDQMLSVLGESIETLVVNDLGMLQWLSAVGKPLRMGRLFMKEPRDFRYPELRIRKEIPSFLEGKYQMLRAQYTKIDGVEVDWIFEGDIFPTDVKVTVHYPYVYQSVGQICFYANLEADTTDFFEANRPCRCSCMEQLICYTNAEQELFRVGRAVVYRQTGVVKENEQTEACYWPLDLWEKER